MKRYKNISGGILLEVLFMLAIIIAIFPFIQSNAKKRSDAIRNQMVVRDLLKLKTAVETYLRRKPTFENNLTDINFTELYDSGLEKSFQKTNVLGQEYKVRVKTSLDADKNTVYDAIIIATGEKSIPSMRIRDIVKEAKGFAGYVEEGLIYGPSWQLSVAPWNEDRGDIDTSSIIVKTGLSKKEYKYISRKPGVGSSTMETDLHMNMQNIYNLRNLHIGGFMEVGSFNLKGDSGAVSEFNDISIAESEADSASETSDNGKASFTLSNGDMTVNGVLRFPLGLIMPSLSFTDNNLKWVMLQQSITVKNNLDFDDETDCKFFADDYENSCNKLRVIFASNMKIPVVTGQSVLAIANLLKFDESILGNVLKINHLTVRSFDNDKGRIANGDIESHFGLKFSNLYVDGNADKLKVDSAVNTIGLKDIIVTELNKKLLSKSSKIGGIDITEKTPLTIILRGLYYEYADIYKIIANEYPSGNGIFLPWHLNLYSRCEYDSNESTACGNGWYY